MHDNMIVSQIKATVGNGVTSNNINYISTKWYYNIVKSIDLPGHGCSLHFLVSESLLPLQ